MLIRTPEAAGRVILLAAILLALAPLSVVSAERSAAATSRRVAMVNNAYSPATLTIRVGTTVTWTNQDQAPHTVTTTSGPEALSSPMLSRGQSWSFTFRMPGTYQYYCTLHPDMRARIVVRPAAPAEPAERHTTHPKPSAHPPGAHPEPGHGSSRHGSATHPEEPAAARPSGHAPASSSPRPAVAPAPSSPRPTAAAAPQGPGTTPTPQPVVLADPAGSSRPLDPLLMLAGVVTGIAVFCLLLLGSRSDKSP